MCPPRLRPFEPFKHLRQGGRRQERLPSALDDQVQEGVERGRGPRSTYRRSNYGWPVCSETRTSTVTPGGAGVPRRSSKVYLPGVDGCWVPWSTRGLHTSSGRESWSAPFLLHWVPLT